VKTILPGAVIGIPGAGENSRMLANVAERMGYRVQTSIEGADVITIVSGNAIDRLGTKRDPAVHVVADFAIVAVRGADRAFAHYPPIAIDRVDGVPDIARMPAPVNSRIVRRAALMVRQIFEEIDRIGVGCVEFTLTPEDRLIVHEVTPYPHPAGYLTFESCVTDQFEQHLRAVCGLPLGSTQMLTPAAMAVVKRGEGEPDWAAAMALPGITIYRDHLIATAGSATLAKQIVRSACKLLRTTL
jgi:phosphoribosylaminoimidazole carboxylase (NCAIR synthetase)